MQGAREQRVRLVVAEHSRGAARDLPAAVATLELEAVDGGTRLTYTEQGAYVDPEDDSGPAGRLEGTEGLLDQLGAFLDG